MGRIKISLTGVLKVILAMLLIVILILGAKMLFAGADSSVSEAARNSTAATAPSDLEGQKRIEAIMSGNTSKMLYGLPVDNFDKEYGTVGKGESFSKLLNGRFNLNIAIVNQLVEKSQKIFDLRDMRAGNNFTAYFAPDSTQTLQYLVYNKSNSENVVFCCLEDSPSVKVEKKEITIRERYFEGVINYSLDATIRENNLPRALGASLNDIFKWSIDFFALQKGDSFKVIYEEMLIDTVSAGIRKIYGAEFKHGGKSYFAISFQQGDEKGYWNHEGVNLKGSVLRSPLLYDARVSSKFGLRTHPVTRRKGTQHNGIDYACPTGTRVLAVADGIVSVKGFDRGSGNKVFIKHSGGLESGYLHLSRFGEGIRQGIKVRQGQVIGYVGSTGMSTGPHLDFRIKKNGTYVNPTSMQSQPGKPIDKANKGNFNIMRDDVLKAMQEYASGKQF